MRLITRNLDSTGSRAELTALGVVSAQIIGLRRLGAKVHAGLRRLLEAHVLFPLFAAMLLVLAWMAIIHLVTVEHAVARGASAELSRELADTYEAQMVRDLVAIDQALKTVKYVYERRGGVRLSELQEQGLLPFAVVFKVAIAGSDGRLSDATRVQAPATVVDQPYFTVQRDRINDSPRGARFSRGPLCEPPRHRPTCPACSRGITVCVVIRTCASCRASRSSR
jgi:hypothetical protein